MKKLTILCVTLMISISTYAQDNIPSTIEVSGTTYFVPANFTYIAEIVVSRDFLYDYYNQNRSLASVQEEYFQQITSLGIDTKEFKEDKIGYLTRGYTKEGVLFTFSTTSIKTLEKVISVTTPGARISRTIISAILSPEQIQEFATAAIEKARKKAKMMAEKQNKKLGKVLKIVDHERDRISNLTYYGEEEYPYSVKVTFALL